MPRTGFVSLTCLNSALEAALFSSLELYTNCGGDVAPMWRAQAGPAEGRWCCCTPPQQRCIMALPHEWLNGVDGQLRAAALAPPSASATASAASSTAGCSCPSLTSFTDAADHRPASSTCHCMALAAMGRFPSSKRRRSGGMGGSSGNGGGSGAAPAAAAAAAEGGGGVAEAAAASSFPGGFSSF